MRTGIRLIAAVLLLAALMPRHYASGSRLLVVDIEGTGLSELRERAGRDGMQTLAGLLDSGVGGPFKADCLLYGAEFWRRLLAVSDAPCRASMGDEHAPWFWQLDGRGVIAVGVPGTALETGAGALVVPGELVAEAFIGDSTGRVVSRRAAKGGGLDWPYVLAGGALITAVDGLAAGSWSPWLELGSGDGRTGIFKVLRLGRDTLYLSPVYRRHFGNRALGLPELAKDLTYVADIPSWTGASSRLTEYYAAHLEEVTAARAAAATALAAGRWRTLIYHEPLLLPLAAAYRAEPQRVDAAYRTLEGRLTKLLATAGSETRVVILASPGPQQGGHGFMWLADGRSGRAEQPMVARGVAATLAGLAGLDHAGPVSAAVLARNWRFGAWRRFGAQAAVSEPVTVELDADRMLEMGILSTTASVVGTE